MRSHTVAVAMVLLASTSLVHGKRMASLVQPAALSGEDISTVWAMPRSKWLECRNNSCANVKPWTEEKPKGYCSYGFGDLFGGGNKMTLAQQQEAILKKRGIPVDNIVASMIRGKSSMDEPEVLILLGGNAAGKTTALNSIGVENFVNAGLDEVLEQLPEYKEEVGNVPTYLDASKDCYPLAMLVLERLYAEVQKRKLSVIVEFTARNWGKKAMPLLKMLGLPTGLSADGGPFFTPDSGYHKLRVIFVDSPSANAIANSNKRAERTGRYIPKEVVAESYNGLDEAFDSAKKMATASESIELLHCVNYGACCDVKKSGKDKSCDEWQNVVAA